MELNNVDQKNNKQKRWLQTIFYAIKNKEVNNTKALFATANISMVAYYKYLKNRDNDAVNRRLLYYIKEMQEYTSFAVGYGPMTAMIDKKFGSNFNKKRIHRIMVDYNLSSIVRL